MDSEAFSGWKKINYTTVTTSKSLQRYIKDQSVDLVYLDPPFNSNQDYNVLFAEKNGNKSGAQIKAFEDTWHWDQTAAEAWQTVVEMGGKVSQAMQAFRVFLGENDMLAYLSMMAPRLIELRRALKETGSIYLHCDPTASHYLKMLMDAIFGYQNWRNEIIWKRTSGHSDAKRFGNVHDSILFYTVSDKYIWNKTFQKYDEEYVTTYYRYSDPDGRKWMSGDLGASGLQGGGYEYEWKGIKRLWRCPRETMEKLEKDNKMYYTKNGFPRIKRYLDESEGIPAQDLWTDIEALRSWHKEKLGYPTQKPEGLLERMLLACSNEGDLVLDPFCGCGTTVAAAQKLNRGWIGIDVTCLAISLMRSRLNDMFGKDVSYEVIGEPVEVNGAKNLAEQDPWQFQWWALGLVGARPIEQKKGADKGIDGRLYFHDEADSTKAKTKQIIFSVKAGNVNVSHIRDLRGVLDRENAQIGVLLSMEEPTKPMRVEAASAGFYKSPGWNKNYPKMQILTIEEILKGKGVDCPPLQQTNITFKKADKAKGKGHKQKEFGFEENIIDEE
ncbi:MAG: DNA methyltransferase [Phycisphaerales bacterium]